MRGDKFADYISIAKERDFRMNKYDLLRNNCRNFCEYLIFDVLRPSDSEYGESI